MRIYSLLSSIVNDYFPCMLVSLPHKVIGFLISHGLVLNCYSHVHTVQWSTHFLSCWTDFSRFTEYLVGFLCELTRGCSQTPSSVSQYISNLLVWPFFLGDRTLGVPQPATPGWLVHLKTPCQACTVCIPVSSSWISLRKSAWQDAFLNLYGFLLA